MCVCWTARTWTLVLPVTSCRLNWHHRRLIADTQSFVFCFFYCKLPVFFSNPMSLFASVHPSCCWALPFGEHQPVVFLISSSLSPLPDENSCYSQCRPGGCWRTGGRDWQKKVPLETSAAAAKYSEASPSAPLLLPRTSEPTDRLKQLPRAYASIREWTCSSIHVFPAAKAPSLEWDCLHRRAKRLNSCI